MRFFRRVMCIKMGTEKRAHCQTKSTNSCRRLQIEENDLRIRVQSLVRVVFRIRSFISGRVECRNDFLAKSMLLLANWWAQMMCEKSKMRACNFVSTMYTH